MRIVVIGAGGHARDTAWVAEEISRLGKKRFVNVGFIVSDLSKVGPHDSEVIGDESFLEEHPERVDGLVLGIGSPRVRLSVGERLAQRFPNFAWPTLVHPTAQFDRRSSTIGRGTMIAAGVIGTVNVSIGEFSVLNPAVTLGHEATIGRGCVMNHASGISGGTTLEDGVLVGTGARVLQYLTIGAGSTVGAGAVVTKDVPAETVVVGVPARSIRR